MRGNSVSVFLSFSFLRCGCFSRPLPLPSSSVQDPLPPDRPDSRRVPPPDLPHVTPAGGPAHPVCAPVQQRAGTPLGLSLSLAKMHMLFTVHLTFAMEVLHYIGVFLLPDVSLVQCGSHPSPNGAERKKSGHFEGRIFGTYNGSCQCV